MLESGYKEILENLHTVEINLNDTFYYACADSEELEAEDILELIPLFENYGVRDTLVAVTAVIRGHDPKVKGVCTSKFKKAKKEIQKMAKNGTICFAQYYENENKKKERAEFGGQMITWSNVIPRHLKMFHNKKTEWWTQLRRATVEDGTFAVGGSIHDTKIRLLKKYKRLKEVN